MGMADGSSALWKTSIRGSCNDEGSKVCCMSNVSKEIEGEKKCQ